MYCSFARHNQDGKGSRHAVLLGEIEISLATLARIQGDEAEFQRLMASGRRRFEELGINRQGRGEQFVIFPADWRPDSQAQPADY
jgi:hypothetical protein